jgi:ABC-type multidrug transport system fused ATPase/permease subunit
VIDDGVVVESGTPAALLRAGGLFTSLFGEEVGAAA